MLYKTAAGNVIEELPPTARCKNTRKHPKNMDTCPRCAFDEEGSICIPELCESYIEYKKRPGRPKKSAALNKDTVPPKGMIYKTATGDVIEELPPTARCKNTRKHPKNMDTCPRCAFDEEGHICIPELCESYIEYKKRPGRPKKSAVPQKHMLYRTATGDVIEELPPTARCKYTRKHQKNMDACPISAFDEEGRICTPELCAAYFEYNKLPGRPKKNAEPRPQKKRAPLKRKKRGRPKKRITSKPKKQTTPKPRKRITEKRLIDYCNANNSTSFTHCTSGCPYLRQECGAFIEKHNTTPFMEDKRHPGYYTNEKL